MLEKSGTATDLGRADDFTPIHKNLATDGLGETGRRMGRRADGRMGGRERGLYAKRPQRSREPRVDLAVRASQ